MTVITTLAKEVVRSSKRNKEQEYGSNLDHHFDRPIRNPTTRPTKQIMSVFWWNFQDRMQWHKEQLIQFLVWPGSSCWLSKFRIPGWSALSECSYFIKSDSVSPEDWIMQLISILLVLDHEYGMSPQ